MKIILKNIYFWFFISILFLLFFLFYFFPGFFGSATSYKQGEKIVGIEKIEKNRASASIVPPLDTLAYNKKLFAIANNPPDPIIFDTVRTFEKDKNGKTITKINKVPLSPQPINMHLWPVKTVYPNNGALLPFNRIVAYYGNLYSTKMGVLGQYPEDEMLQKLQIEVKNWQEADPTTPVIPALHYIVVVAQGSAGTDGKYRFRMPDTEIDKVLAMAAKINAIVFLDIQVGFSTLEEEVPKLEKYLKMPQVHLGIDPEFSMKTGIKPGKIVGTFDAADINFTSNYLAKIVKENNLTPKILVIHRYTQKMVTNYKQIKTLPEVQIVMNMDGWGDQAHKLGTYQNFIYKEPVQFTGFKLFYKNDLWTKGSMMMTPNTLLKLTPQPVYIQYQ